MNYICELGHGRTLWLEHDGEQTLVGFASGDEGQRQSQARGCHTGEATGAPEVFRLNEALVIRVKTKDGDKGIHVVGSRIEVLDKMPDLAYAEKLDVKESSEAGFPKMKPMEPMKPIKPMKPMRWN